MSKKSATNVRAKKPNHNPPPMRKLRNNRNLEADDDNNSSITNFFKPSQSKKIKSSSDRLDAKLGNLEIKTKKDEPQMKKRKNQPQPENHLLTDGKLLGKKFETKSVSELAVVWGLKRQEASSETTEKAPENVKLETKLLKDDSINKIISQETVNDLSQMSSEFTGSQESEKTGACKKLFKEVDLFKELTESDDEKLIKKKSKKSAPISNDEGIKRYFQSTETKSNEKCSKKPVSDLLSSIDDDFRPTQRVVKKVKKKTVSTAMVQAKKNLKFEFDDSSSDDMVPQHRLNDKRNSKTKVLVPNSFEETRNRNIGHSEKEPCLSICNLPSSQSSEQSERTVPNTRSQKNKLLLSSSQSSQENDKYKPQCFTRIPKTKRDDEKTTSPLSSNWLSKKNQPKITTPPKKKVRTPKSSPMFKYSRLSDKEYHKQFKSAKVKNYRNKRILRKKEDISKQTKEILKTPPRPKNSKIKMQLAMIDEIGEKLKMNDEKNKKCEELEKKLLDNIIIISSPTIAKTREKLAEMNTFILESTLLNLPPGLNIMDSKQFHCYFHNICDLNDENFEKCLPNVLNDKDIGDTSEIFLDKLFKVVSSLNDDISLDVHPLLERLVKKNREWHPKIHHIVVALINFGVTIEDCPLQELFLNQKLRLDQMGTREENIFDEILSSEEKQRKMLAGNNLIMMFEILHLCLTRGNTYDTSTLCNFIITICWIRMEKNYLEHPMCARFQECCSLALNHIPEEVWDEKKQFLSSKLSEMDPKWHHHNLAFLAEFIPTSARGIKLQQLTSFKMLKFLYNYQKTSVDEKFDYEILYDFLKKNPVVVKQDNYYESRSKILLINCCLDLQGDWRKEKEYSLTYLKKIGNLLHSFSKHIIDCMRQQDSTEIKNLLIEIRCKVVLYCHGRDVKEASSDCLMDNSQPSPTKEQKRVRKQRNLFSIEDG